MQRRKRHAKKPFPAKEEGLDFPKAYFAAHWRMQKEPDSKSPSPSLAGQTAIVNQAVLLAPVPRAAAPSQRCFSNSSGMISAVHSLLQWRDRAGL